MIFKKTENWDTREVYTPKKHANPCHCAGQIIEYGPEGQDGTEKGFYFVPSCEEVYLSKSDLEEIIKEMK